MARKDRGPDREWTRRIDSRHLDRVFTLVLLLLVLVLLYDVRLYGRDAQLFPVVVGVSAILLLTVLLIAQHSTRLSQWLDRFSSSGMTDQIDELQSAGETKETPDLQTQDDSAAGRTRVAHTVGWILFLFGLIFVIGFLPATLVFMGAFYRFEVGTSWSKTLLYTLTVWIVLVIIFDVVLNTPFYHGLLGIRFTLPI